MFHIECFTKFYNSVLCKNEYPMIRKKSSWKISDEGIIARLITRPIIDDFNRIASLELLFQLLPFSFFLFFFIFAYRKSVCNYTDGR